MSRSQLRAVSLHSRMSASASDLLSELEDHRQSIALVNRRLRYVSTPNAYANDCQFSARESLRQALESIDLALMELEELRRD